MEDTQIVDLFWSRDETAIEKASSKYKKFCFHIAWKILMNREDSEESVNDTWFAAWKYIPPKRPTILSSFFGKITRGFTMDKLRKKYAAKRIDMRMFSFSIIQETESLNQAVKYFLQDKLDSSRVIIYNNCRKTFKVCCIFCTTC